MPSFASSFYLVNVYKIKWKKLLTLVFTFSPTLLFVLSCPSKMGDFGLYFWNITHLHHLSLSLTLNKWFPHEFIVFLWFRRLNATLFCLSSSCVLLFFHLSLWLHNSYLTNQFRSTKNMIWISMLLTWRHRYSIHFDFITYENVLSFFAFNSTVVNLLSYSFLLVLVVFYFSIYILLIRMNNFLRKNNNLVMFTR